MNDNNITNFPNIIKNQKYNIITLIPLVFFNQFSYFANQFYLLMAASQFIKVLQVGFMFSYIAPLALVLMVTIIKEAYDDFYRYRRDKEANDQRYNKLINKGFKSIKSSDIEVGDIIELNINERIPADMVLIKSFDEEHGKVYIRTDQLDGETDWKLRKPTAYSQRIRSLERIYEVNGYLNIDPPYQNIYEFNGVINFNDSGTLIKEPLGLENTLWANTIMASKRALGIVIYTGKETRMQMNTSIAKTKFGKLDLEINLLSKVLFALMIVLSLVMILIKGMQPKVLENFITFFRFVVLLCSIIPISLRVNLDIAKAINSVKISREELIPETLVRNSQIPEELGRIEYLFSDKTGTLTKNEMIFKKLYLETDQFNEENLEDLKLIVFDECKVNNGPMLDLLSQDKKLTEQSTKKLRRNRNKVVRDSVSALVLCNNVTPIKGDDDKYFYEASSPDEVALVQLAESLNMQLISRSDNSIVVRNPNFVEEKYEILANFPFTSESKRMGIILRNLEHGHIIFYMKGAEIVIEQFVKEEYKSYIKENCEVLACSGLRTLVLTQKLLSEEFFQEWIKIYNECSMAMEGRKEKIKNAISLLENNMDFLCVTGVEGK